MLERLPKKQKLIDLFNRSFMPLPLLIAGYGAITLAAGTLGALINVLQKDGMNAEAEKVKEAAEAEGTTPEKEATAGKFISDLLDHMILGSDAEKEQRMENTRAFFNLQPYDKHTKDNKETQDEAIDRIYSRGLTGNRDSEGNLKSK